MQRILIFFFCFLICACEPEIELAQPPADFPQLPDTGLELPEKFRGWWKPYSKTAAWVGIDLQDNGWMVYRYTKTNEVIDKYPYRVINIIDQNSVGILVVHTNSLPDQSVNYYILTYENWKDTHSYLGVYETCSIHLEPMRSPSKIENFIEGNKECNAYYTGETYVRD